MTFLIILPNTLFKKKYIPKFITHLVLFEHPHYFTRYKFNKKKLVLHRASMVCYKDYLKKYNYSVTYVNHNKSVIQYTKKKYYMFDCIDKLKIKKNINCTVIESPNFLLKLHDYETYRKKTDKFSFNGFYTYAKKVNNSIIQDVKSTDKQNRKKPKRAIKSSLPKINDSEYSKYVKPAINYVEKHFKTNYGNTISKFIYPVSFKSAKRYLTHFIKNKFNKFGDYQDYIDKNDQFTVHSILSSSINIGLINPTEIIKTILPLKNKIKINNYEGYIRQLYWREYQRFTFIYYFCKLSNTKQIYYKTGTKNLSKKWYTGNLKIKIIDNTINKAFDTAYLHHIDRLMMIGNFMNLYGIKPLQGFKWFMEFSIDSYEWVMYQNVLDMVFFITGGKTMRRAYIASSNYLKKMSNYNDKKSLEQIQELYDKFKKINKINSYGFKKK